MRLSLRRQYILRPWFEESCKVSGVPGLGWISTGRLTDFLIFYVINRSSRVLARSIFLLSILQIGLFSPDDCDSTINLARHTIFLQVLTVPALRILLVHSNATSFLACLRFIRLTDDRGDVPIK